jgi:ATP-binding protein involved in chromosome partitioning
MSLTVASHDELLGALEAVIDPELRRSIVDLGMVRHAAVDQGGVARVVVALTTPGCPIRDHFERHVRAAVTPLRGVSQVAVEFGVLSDAERAQLGTRLGRTELPAGTLARVRTVLCVASGKGGVGKSTLSANLGVAFAIAGERVGVLDCDVWGYSLPRILGVRGRPEINAERKLEPPVAELRGGERLKVMSIGFFLEGDQAVVWRGPMLHKTIQQFLEDVEWGELDHLIVDLPPGTGDVSMSLAQFLPQARFVLITTPQLVARSVALRAAQMALKVDHEVVGVIENMSTYIDPDGARHPIFGSGGGGALATELGVPLLGEVPITLALREHADAGKPLVSERPDDPAAVAIRAVAERISALAPQPALPMAVLPTDGPSGVALPMA